MTEPDRWPGRVIATARAARSFVAVFVALFIVRVELRGVFVAVTPEECHTGGIARELLAHGVQFPLLSYSPERYENGIVLQGFLAVPFIAALGPNGLALKVLALVVATIVTLLGLALLDRVLTALDVRAPSARAVAIAAYLVATLFSPARFLFEGMDALGDENEATAMTLGVLVLFFRRIERPTVARAASLWLTAGGAFFFHKGTLLATALAGVYELAAMRGERTPRRVADAVFASAALGFAPAFVVSQRSGFQDSSTILAKFPWTSPGAMLGGLGRSIWSFSDHRAALIAIVVASLVWAAARFRPAPSLDSPLPWLGAYLALHLALMSAAHDHEDYWYYAYPVALLPVAALVGALTPRVAAIAALRRVPVAALGGALLVGLFVGLWPRLGVELGAPLRLLQDEPGVCSWRFGRAFLTAQNGSVAGAIAVCRRLEGDAALDCISGVGFEQYPRPPASFDAQAIDAGLFEGRPSERRAFVFGVGRMLARGAATADDCRGFDGDDRDVCAAGARIECVSYADLYGRLLIATPAPRPSCLSSATLADVPVDGFARPALARFVARPNEPRSVVMGEHEGCFRVLTACYPEVSDPAAAVRKSPP